MSHDQGAGGRVHALGGARTSVLPRLGLAVAAALLVSHSLAAQTVTATLDSLTRAADAGRVEEARSGLARWFQQGGGAAGSPEEARARFLRARLNLDADSAEVDYRWVAVEGGEYATPARLRLAQLRFMRGEPSRAVADLERLRADDPRSPLVAPSWLWSGYALVALGDVQGACTAWGRARDLAELGAESVREAARLAFATCGQKMDRYRVQLGAFRTRAAAAALRDQVEARGFKLEVSAPDGADGLYRVRSAALPGRQAAEELVARFSSLGIAAFLVKAERE